MTALDENASPAAAASERPVGRLRDRLREQTESVVFSAALHEYASFEGKQVLDVGCGNGYVLSRYAQHGARDGKGQQRGRSRRRVHVQSNGYR